MPLPAPQNIPYQTRRRDLRPLVLGLELPGALLENDVLDAVVVGCGGQGGRCGGVGVDLGLDFADHGGYDADAQGREFDAQGLGEPAC